MAPPLIRRYLARIIDGIYGVPRGLDTNTDLGIGTGSNPVNYMVSSGTGTNVESVYGFACGKIEDLTILPARLINYLPHPGTSPVNPEDTGTPIYGVAHECCICPRLSKVDNVCIDGGMPNLVQATLHINDTNSVAGQQQHCGQPECTPKALIHGGTDGMQGSAWTNYPGDPLTIGPGKTLFIKLACNTDTDTWVVTLSGCTDQVLTAPNNTNLCGELNLAWIDVPFNADGCCTCLASSQLTITLVLQAYALKCYKLARLVNYVETNLNIGTGTSTPMPGPLRVYSVYGYSECCTAEGENFAPPCCWRIPCQLYATITSSCPGFNGAVIPLNYQVLGANEGHWSGTLVTDVGTISVGFTCEYAEDHVGEYSCPSPTRICAPEGYMTCSIKRYYGGDLSTGVQCGNAQWGNSGEVCGQCDCDAPDFEFDLIFAGFADCGCADEGMSVRITV